MTYRAGLPGPVADAPGRQGSSFPATGAACGARPATSLAVMEALAERLSGLDSYAEGAVRVIAFYDTLS